MAKKVFEKNFLRNELDLPYNAIKDTITDNSRWSIHHDIIFEYGGKFYETSYSVGATEQQWETPWEYDDTVECWEVELKEVTVKEWRVVE